LFEKIASDNRPAIWKIPIFGISDFLLLNAVRKAANAIPFVFRPVMNEDFGAVLEMICLAVDRG
jgi:hypothetical protein